MDNNHENSRLSAIEAILERSAIEAERRHAKFEQQMMQSKAEADKQAAEAKKTMEDLKASIKQVNQQMGGMANSNGAVAQEYFFNALYNRKTLFGQEFDEVKTEKRKIKKTGVEVQYDILLINGKSVCIVEVKYKADTDDVRMIPNMTDKFRQNYHEHADKKLYLALASLSFDEYVENECKKLGIAIIKQVGDTIEIYDEHLKVL